MSKAMRVKTKISREKIIHAINDGLKDNPAVLALWLEGSDSNNTIDKFSDLDFWLDVKDGKECEVFLALEKILKKLSPLTFSSTIENSDPNIAQGAYHLAGTEQTLIIDVCIQRHSRNFTFIKEHTHERPKVLFDKCNVIKFVNLNHREEGRHKEERVEYLKSIYSQQGRIVAKIKRKDFLEALIYYHKWTLMPLVELLRIRYSPLKRDYYLKHISRDLPKKVVIQLEELYRVSSPRDIQLKLVKANKLFRKTLAKF